MNFDKFIETYIKPNGVLNKRNFSSAVMLAISFLILANINLLRMVSYYFFEEPEITGLLGLLNLSDSKVIFFPISVLPIDAAITFLMTYILFVATLKYCRGLMMSNRKSFLLATSTIFPVLFAPHLYRYITIVINEVNLVPVLDICIKILLGIAGITTIIYLYCTKETETSTRDNSRLINKMATTGIFTFVLITISNYMLLTGITKFPLREIIIIIFIIVYTHQIWAEAKKRWSKLPNAWVLVSLFVLLEIVYSCLILVSFFNTDAQIIVNYFMSIVEPTFMFFLLILLLPVMNENVERGNKSLRLCVFAKNKSTFKKN